MLESTETYQCPVCGWPDLPYPAYDDAGSSSFEICPCCGVQFGYDDASRSHAELRAEWIARGTPWYSRAQHAPAAWDPAQQLLAAGF